MMSIMVKDRQFRGLFRAAPAFCQYMNIIVMQNNELY